jgi:hypothetical protein
MSCPFPLVPDFSDTLYIKHPKHHENGNWKLDICISRLFGNKWLTVLPSNLHTMENVFSSENAM